MKGKRKFKKRIVLFLFLGIIAAVLIRASLMKSGDISYSEEVAKTRDITTYFTFSGNIEAKENQQVFSQGVLPVKTFHVKEGDMVSPGDLLFELDDSSIKTNLDQARASIEIARINYENAIGPGKEQQLAQVENALSSAKIAYDNAVSNLERMTELFNSGTISEAELEQAQSAHDNALLSLESAQKNYDIVVELVKQNIRTAQQQLNQSKASYSSLEKQLEDTKVYAEVNGEVDEIYVEENDSLVMGTKIMDIVNYDDLEVIIKVDEYDLKAVTLGKEVEVIINALDKKITGTVSDISRQAQVVNGVSYFPTSISLQKDADLRVGMSAEVKILNQDVKNAVTISMKALQFDNENKPFVYYRDSEGKVVSRYVEVGINDGIFVQILDGVQSGETILIPNKKLAPFAMTMNRGG